MIDVVSSEHSNDLLYGLFAPFRMHAAVFPLFRC
jgi:hypothetical protein